MATVSRQSAFWAIVALGLNTFTQPGGKVLGFPAEYSRALRLSPIVCIVDTLVVLFSLAFFCVKTRSFKDGLKLAARYRCFVEDDPAEPKLERTWWFRFSVFALGALPQAMKILGMGGIPLTKTWGMAYLVSFLVLGGLDLLQPRQHRDYHAVEMDVEEVLDGYLRLPGSLAVFTQHLCFLLQLYLSTSKLDLMCDMARDSSPSRSELGRATTALIIIGVLTACFAWTVLVTAFFFVTMQMGRRVRRDSASLDGDLGELEPIAFCLMSVFYYSHLIWMSISMEATCSFRAVLVLMVAINLLLTSAALPFALNEKAFENRWFRGFFALIRYSRKLFGLKEGERDVSVLFATSNIAGLICYYMCIYDPSSTYKPPWTEYLG